MKIGKSDITHFLLGHVWSCDTVRLIVCGQKHLMDYYDYHNTNHEFTLWLNTTFCIFQALKDGRVPGETTHSKGTKPYSCLTYFHVMFLMIPTLTKVKVWVWYGKLWTINMAHIWVRYGMVRPTYGIDMVPSFVKVHLLSLDLFWPAYLSIQPKLKTCTCSVFINLLQSRIRFIRCMQLH